MIIQEEDVQLKSDNQNAHSNGNDDTGISDNTLNGSSASTTVGASPVENSSQRESYDVVIVGAGVSGTALLYVLSHYTNVKRIALVEKCDGVAQINSRVSNNSQTLHFGDIETNYSFEKAKKVNKAASLVKNYLLKKDPECLIYSQYHKMVLAVGHEQVEKLKTRYSEFKSLFPDLKLIDRETIAQLEPKLLDGRSDDQEILALFTESGYTVDFQRLAQSFLEAVQAKADPEQHADSDVIPHIATYFSTKVHQITHTDQQYQVKTSKGMLSAKVVVVAAGSHSLLFAKSLGYGKDFALLCVAGSFFMTSKALQGKVYTLQHKELPFAAIHGDPEVHDADVTRFGPTAKVLPLLERHDWLSIIDYLRTAGISLRAFLSFFNILSNPFIFKYILRNLMYDAPGVGRLLFIQEVRKIIPNLQLKDLKRAVGYGGVRPQIVNMQTRSLQMGEAKIFGDNIIFNITPSPGASTCLQSAEDDTQKVINFLGDGYQFDQDRFLADLGVVSEVA